MWNLGFRNLSLKSAAAKLEFKSRSHPFMSSLISMPCGLDEAKPGDPGDNGGREDNWGEGPGLGRTEANVTRLSTAHTVPNSQKG